MNREMRLELIAQIISEQEVKTQEELQQLLLERGLQVTQATISRDIHTLQLIKVPSKDGSLKYSFKIDQEHLISEKLKHKLRDALVSMEVIQFIIVVKTLPGHAHSFGALFDSMELEGKAGTLCGNDTCLIICRSPEQAENIKQQLDVFSEV
jgi:transcriptional regulator of arginine metabolism